MTANTGLKGPTPKRIALVSGFWGQNIGNAFYNVGGKHALEASCPGARVEFIQDQPGYRTFHKQHTGNPVNDLGLLKHIEADYIVLQGPMLTTTFRALWRDTFASLRRKGTRVILLSAALFRYTDEEVALNREFLKEIEPVIFSTRDLPTYEAFKDLSPYSHAGVDSAFFVPDTYAPYRLDLPPYLAVNFDRFPEPRIRTAGVNSGLPRTNESRASTFSALGCQWSLAYPRFQEWMSHKGKIQSYLGAMVDFRKLPSEVAGYLVVRPEHRFNPHITWKIYGRPNAVASDEPWTYFTVYANAQMTISDRVHACIATLAYGKPAILYRHTKRAYVFDRVGAGSIGSEAVTVDPHYLRREKDALISFLRDAWRKLEPSLTPAGPSVKARQGSDTPGWGSSCIADQTEEPTPVYPA